MASHQILEITAKTDEEIYQHPILRKKGMNNMMLRDQFCVTGNKCRYIVWYNDSDKEEVGDP